MFEENRLYIVSATEIPMFYTIMLHSVKARPEEMPPILVNKFGNIKPLLLGIILDENAHIKAHSVTCFFSLLGSC